MRVLRSLDTVVMRPPGIGVACLTIVSPFVGVAQGHGPRPPCCPTLSPGHPVPIISVDDHLIEPPDLFEGRLPAASAGAPASSRRTTGPSAGSSRIAAIPTSGSTPWWAGPARVEHGAGPLRPDAARLLRHRRPHRRHGPGRHLGLALLPLARVGFLRCGLLAGAGQGPGPGLPARLQRLAPRGLGRAPTPSASSRCSCPTWPTWPSRGGRGAPTRRAASRR
jgi:hypothetical protein